MQLSVHVCKISRLPVYEGKLKWDAAFIYPTDCLSNTVSPLCEASCLRLLVCLLDLQAEAVEAGGGALAP